MTAACFSLIDGKAKARGEQTRAPLRRVRNYSRSNFLLLNKFRELHPVKTAVYLSEITGAPVRTCEYWLAEETLPTDAVWALLQTDRGLELLTAAMADSRPEWWKRLLRVGLIASVMRRRETDLRLIKKTLEVDRDLTTAIARATALSVQDEEFHQPFIDAVSAIDGVPHSAMVASSKKGGR